MRPSIVLILGLLSTSLAFAEPLKYKDWMTNAGPDEVFAKEACLAATNVATGSARAQLLLSFTKDQQTVPQLLLKVWNTTPADAQLTVKVSSKVSYPLFLWKPSTQPEEPSIYWYAPIGWKPLMDHIAAANNLSVTGPTTKLSISLSGSSVSLERTTKCLGVKQALPLDFLTKLNTKTATVASIYNSIDEMIAGNEKTFEAYRVGSAKTAELAALQKGSSGLLTQEKSALDKFNQAQGKVDATRGSLDSNLAAQPGVEQQIASLTSQIPTLEAQLVPLQQVLAQKEAAYAPAYDQYRPFVERVNSAQSALDSNQSAGSRLQSRLNEIDRTLPGLQTKRNGYPSKISSLENRLRNEKYEYEDARRRADFNVDSEIQNRLRSDFRYNSYKRDEERYSRDAQNLRGEESNARSNLRTAEDRLRQCQGTPGQDCSALQATVREREARVNEISRALRDAEREVQQARSNADMIYRSISSDVQNEKRNLERIADNHRDQYRRTESEIGTLESEYRSVSAQVSTLEDERSRLNGQLQNTLAQRPSLQQELNFALTRRDEARVRLDIDRLSGEYEAALAPVESLRGTIGTKKSELQAAQSRLVRIKADIETLKATLVKDTEARDQAAVVLKGIQDQLVDFRAKEAVLVKAIADLAVDFDNGKATYQKSYEIWIAPTATMMAIGTFL